MLFRPSFPSGPGSPGSERASVSERLAEAVGGWLLLSGALWFWPEASLVSNAARIRAACVRVRGSGRGGGLVVAVAVAAAGIGTEHDIGLETSTAGRIGGKGASGSDARSESAKSACTGVGGRQAFGRVSAPFGAETGEKRFRWMESAANPKSHIPNRSKAWKRGGAIGEAKSSRKGNGRMGRGTWI